MLRTYCIIFSPEKIVYLFGGYCNHVPGACRTFKRQRSFFQGSMSHPVFWELFWGKFALVGLLLSTSHHTMRGLSMYAWTGTRPSPSEFPTSAWVWTVTWSTMFRKFWRWSWWRFGLLKSGKKEPGGPFCRVFRSFGSGKPAANPFKPFPANALFNLGWNLYSSLTRTSVWIKSMLARRPGKRATILWEMMCGLTAQSPLPPVTQLKSILVTTVSSLSRYQWTTGNLAGQNSASSFPKQSGLCTTTMLSTVLSGELWSRTLMTGFSTYYLNLWLAGQANL